MCTCHDRPCVWQAGSAVAYFFHEIQHCRMRHSSGSGTCGDDLPRLPLRSGDAGFVGIPPCGRGLRVSARRLNVTGAGRHPLRDHSCLGSYAVTRLAGARQPLRTLHTSCALLSSYYTRIDCSMSYSGADARRGRTRIFHTAQYKGTNIFWPYSIPYFQFPFWGNLCGPNKVEKSLP
jgi:hypothetical protein